MDKIVVKGAREHNLKNIDVEIPRDKLVVVSGVSGSGKSSLVFDTLFAEGQRRYVESLSAYARQFLGRMDKPDVDYIEGLSPAISIEQKTTGRNPRSTVGTITEIYDYLRLLYARIGQAYCPNDGTLIAEQSLDQIIEQVLSLPEGEKLIILAPVIKGRKGEHQKVLDDAKAMGFARVRVDGTIYSLDEDFQLEKQKKHSIDIVIDRLKLQKEQRKRLAEAIESALSVGGGAMYVSFADESGRDDLFFSENGSCPQCGFSMPPLEPRLFSFNNPFGSCPECSGLGMTLEFDEDLIIPDRSLSYEEGGFVPFNPSALWYRSMFEGLANHYNFKLSTPIEKLDPKVLKIIMEGSGKEKIRFRYTNKEGSGHFERTVVWEGVYAELKRRYRESASENVQKYYEEFMREQLCPSCKGERLRPEALAVKIAGKNINELTNMAVRDELKFFKELKLTETEAAIGRQIFKEIYDRLHFMESVGLDYLALSRKAGTLSGGEAQRIRLATQIGSSLMGVLYILDEPTIGLHQRDNDRLIATLKHLRDLGNTLVVVEHDDQIIRDADYLIDIGPGAGIHGGHVVAKGTPQEVAAIDESPTGRYLSGKETIEVPKERRGGNGNFLAVRGARFHNLKNIDVKFPVGAFNVITGVSGSGKSTLLNDIIYPAVNNAVNRTRYSVGDCDGVEGIKENFDSLISIDQAPIGRTPRSNPATYVGVWTPIRDLFAGLNESKARGYKSGRFSFNVKGGRCEACEGSGVKKIEMHFLPDVFVTCDVCGGKRFNKETLEVRYKGKNIDDVLRMTIEEAAAFFEAIPAVKRKLDTLIEVGLSYIELGQSALTLSGGEAQRVKLALELSKRSTGKTCYIIDEPTTGLHFLDVKKLLVSLQSLVERGNTVILIEHNLDVIKCADYLVDLGPEGGDKGGSIMAVGTPEAIAASKKSYTGAYLKNLLPVVR
jgi:excinuclease ABC subunit A